MQYPHLWASELVDLQNMINSPASTKRISSFGERLNQDPETRAMARRHFLGWQRDFERCEMQCDGFYPDPQTIDEFILRAERLVPYVDVEIVPWLPEVLERIREISLRTFYVRAGLQNALYNACATVIA